MTGDSLPATFCLVYVKFMLENLHIILVSTLPKKICPESRVAALFEPTIDNNGSHAHEKEDGIIEMLEDYNERYGQDFSILHTLSIRKMLLIVLHIYGSHSHAHRKYSRYCGLFRQGHGLFY